MREVVGRKGSKLLRDARWVAGSLYLAKIVHIPCSIIIAGVLGPLMYGTWNALHLVINYSSFLQLGIYDGLTREVPLYEGKGNSEKVRALRETGFAFSVLTALAGTSILLFATWVYKERYSAVVIQGLQVIAVSVSFYHIYGFYQYFLRAQQNFVLLSRLRILVALGGSILQIGGVLLYGIYGLFISFLLVYLGIVLYLLIVSPIRLRIPGLKLVGHLMRVGIPMLLTGMSDVVLYSVDRLVILNSLGRKELGYYSVAILAATFIDFIPTSFQTVLLPRVMKEMGKADGEKIQDKLWLRPIYMLGFLLPAVGGLGWVLSPLGLTVFFPKYLPGLLALKILLFGICFAAVPALTRNLFIAANRQYRVMTAFLVCIGVNLCLCFLFLRFGWGIAGIALAMSLTFLLLGVIMIYMALCIHDRVADLPSVLLRIYGPSLVVVAVVSCLEMVGPGSGGIREELVSTAFKLGAYLPVLFFLMLFIEKKTRMVSAVLYGRKTDSLSAD